MDLKTFKKEVREELNSILSYWISHTPDETYGGFVGQILADDEIIYEAERGLVMYSRILWTFSRAYLNDPKEAYRAIATRAYNYLWEHFWDKEYSGAFWSVDFKGNPKQTHKQIYGQGFLLYGLSEFYKAFGVNQALERAILVFKTIEKYGYDEEHGGYYEVGDRAWNIVEDKIITNGEAKSMNTHLHIIEPYANLLTVWQDAVLRNRIEKLLKLFLEKIINPETNTQYLFFSKDWKPSSETVSFGHDIESSWLIYETAQILGNLELIEPVKQSTLKMAYESLKGIDKDGGMFNEKSDSHLNKEKHWWVQAEAMVGFFNAYELTNDIEFLKSVFQIWEFIKDKLVTNTGEWYWGIAQDNSIMTAEDKVGMWKCPYHNVRALIEVNERVELIQNKDLD